MDSFGALAGLRVLDLSRVLAGPLCGQMLADHGADVVKVEPPVGDETRTYGPPFVDGSGAYFTSVNRGKRNVCLDLASPAGQEVLGRLLEGADVLIENFNIGTMERWGFGYPALAERFPGLIYCRISGYGEDGPLGGLPGYDAAVQAYSGIMANNGYPDGDALRVGLPIVDLLTGNHAFSGILLALQDKNRTGLGQFVDITLFDSALTFLRTNAASWFFSGEAPPRTGDAHPTVAPYQTFTAADGRLFIAAANDRAFRVLCAVLGRPELADDDRYRTNGDRVTLRDELAATLAPLIARRDATDLAAELMAAGVAAAPVNDIPTVLQLEHTRFRDMVVEIDGYRGIGAAIKLSRTAAQPHTAPRHKGADTVEILRGLNYADADIEAITQPVRGRGGPGLVVTAPAPAGATAPAPAATTTPVPAGTTAPAPAGTTGEPSDATAAPSPAASA